MKEKKTLEDKYVKLEHREQILLRPDSTIGSVVSDESNMFVAEYAIGDNIKIKNKIISYNPGFFKIFDEVLTNASDHSIRTGLVRYIKINVEKDNITIENDGPGIPIQIHKKEKLYLPEMLFGNLLTSENYDETIERTWSGRNGVGVKAANIFSKKFTIETCDGKYKYNQTFTENMSKKTKPVIVPSKKNYTKIKFYPDFEKFGMIDIDDDKMSLIMRRCVDVSMYCSGIKVYFNDKLFNVKTFKDYMKFFEVDENNIFYEKCDENWEIGVSSSLDGNFNHVSMVNGISTYNGGTHVNIIINQIVKEIGEILSKKYKKITIKPNDIKNKLFLFVNTKVVNPSFNEQSKETLKTKIINAPKISEKLIKNIVNSSIISELIDFLTIKDSADAKKEIGKHKIKISKLDDAKKAGTYESDKCYLTLCEGDSASSSVIAGLSEVDSSYWGVFPLRGKPLNVRDASLQKIKDNEEIKNIISILGLEFGKKYTDTKKLRYGKVLFFSDNDVDGSHIKGLLINFIDTFWPELLKCEFIYEFATPIMKIYDDKKYVKYFYRLNEWEKFKTDNNVDKFHKKYYKGLGTIEPDEMKGFFKNIKKHLIPFHYDSKVDTENLIDMIFRDNRADDRKEWMKDYVPIDVIDKFSTKQTYDKFINSEIMEWSMADNNRMIPSLVDGLKPVQRKVIYTMNKRGIRGEIKVSSLSGAVIDQAGYHNGNVSLEQAVVNMAQDFVGTNNYNIILPKGQFGSRLKGGKDSAASRYIFTKFNDTTKYIFRKDDDPILTYMNDDGTPIEPSYYIPIIPMILVNGATGIGSGYSTDIPSYNPLDIIIYLQNKIKKKKNIELNPYYKDFRGEIFMDLENKRYVTRGLLHKISDLVYEITELPIWTYNDKYYEFLDELCEDKKDKKTGKLIRKAILRDWTKSGNEKDIYIKIYLLKDASDEFKDNIYKSLKMESYVSFSNMHLFDENKKIKKYVNQYEIIDNFYDVRLDFYNKRKEYQLEKFRYDIEIIKNRMIFIKEVVDGNLLINKRTREAIEKDLIKMNLMMVNDSYSYLLNMSILSLTKEKLVELKDEWTKMKEKMKELESTPIEDIWLEELTELKKELK